MLKRLRLAAATTFILCFPISDAFAASLAAGTWGGVVRAGPGIETKKLASLREGDRVTILGRSAVEMNGYPWFKIGFGGRTGFMWGGLLCSLDKPRPNIFETCPGVAAAAPSRQPATAAVPGATQTASVDAAPNYVRGPLRYVCQGGAAPVMVSFVETADRSFVVVNDSRLGRVELQQVPSGSGFRYSDGSRSFVGKGNAGAFSWRSATRPCGTR